MKICPVCKCRKKNKEFQQGSGKLIYNFKICNTCMDNIDKKSNNADVLINKIAQRLM